MDLPERLQAQLNGEEGPTRQKGARLVVDLALTAGASSFVEVKDSHVSGVSVITGGDGLIRFLEDLTEDGGPGVSIPTTLNSAGCDADRMEEMDLGREGFLEAQLGIVDAYTKLGIRPTLSCTPYDRGQELEEGIACWAESNAVCYANSWTKMRTNRESGLSALATALTGFAPRWGLHLDEHRLPNIRVEVTATLSTLADYSILGDWIGAQAQPGWSMPWGPMPLIMGLEAGMTFAERKALTAAAANYGTPMLWVNGISAEPPLERDGEDWADPQGGWQGTLVFDDVALAKRREELAPKGTVDLVVIGCPQASLEEIRLTAAAVRAHAEMGSRIPDGRLWMFTSKENHALAEADGSLAMLEESGAVVLKDTCPEVTPYNRERFNHLLTNSMKAEHYLTSGLNRIPTSVADIQTCVAHAFDATLAEGPRPELGDRTHHVPQSNVAYQDGMCELTGAGLSSQPTYRVVGRAMVTDVPITYLGYVDRDTGEIDERGHPLDGRAIEGKVLIYPKGSGSTVAPYVLMGLMYNGRGPTAIVNRDVCPLSLPAASLLGLPYAHGFGEDPCLAVNDGDLVEVVREAGGEVHVRVLERAERQG
jgi:predicted aconitase/predicted aconitase with swiveling domain